MGINDYIHVETDPAIIVKEKRPPFDTEEPNELTRKTLEMAERGEELHYPKDAEDLFRQLSI